MLRSGPLQERWVFFVLSLLWAIHWLINAVSASDLPKGRLLSSSPYTHSVPGHSTERHIMHVSLSDLCARGSQPCASAAGQALAFWGQSASFSLPASSWVTGCHPLCSQSICKLCHRSLRRVGLELCVCALRKMRTKDYFIILSNQCRHEYV